MSSNSTTTTVKTQQQKRKANWSKEASLYLLQLILEKKNIIEGKRFDKEVTAKKDRKDAWKEITTRVNEVYHDAIRVKSDVEKKWWALKAQGREELAKHKKVLEGTGDGLQPKALSEVAIAVQGILEPNNTPIAGLMTKQDNDAILASLHGDDEPVQVVEKGMELPEAAAVLDVDWEENPASPTVLPICSKSTSSASIPPVVQTPRPLSMLTSTPSSSLSQARCEKFPDSDYTAKRRKLDIELAEVNLEIRKAELALLRAQAAKTVIETKALELECEERALKLSQKRAFKPCQPTTDSL